MAKRTIVTRVTEAQAEAVLAEIRPWLRRRPRIGQFREQLDATVEIVWAIHRAAKHYRAADAAIRQLRRSTKQAKIALQAMEESAAAPEMINFVGVAKLPKVHTALVAVNKLERALSRLPPAFSGQPKPGTGRSGRAWYSGFVRDLAEIGRRRGIRVTTGGDRSQDPYATPFTRFVFAVEKLLPRTEQARSLTTCARRIDRAIAASADEIFELIPRARKSLSPATFAYDKNRFRSVV
jgi:hypothetical protein